MVSRPSFICELALVVSPAIEGVMLSRFEAARQMYNALLGEAMRRVRLIRQYVPRSVSMVSVNLACKTCFLQAHGESEVTVSY